MPSSSDHMIVLFLAYLFSQSGKSKAPATAHKTCQKFLHVKDEYYIGRKKKTIKITLAALLAFKVIPSK